MHKKEGNSLSHTVAQGGNFSIGGANLPSPTPFPLAPALNIGPSALPNCTSNLYTNSFPCRFFSRLVRQNKQLQNPIATVTGKGKFRPPDSKTAQRISTSRSIYGNNFIKQHSETVMDWNSQNANCSWRKNVVSFIIIYGTLSFSMWNEKNTLPGLG